MSKRSKRRSKRRGVRGRGRRGRGGGKCYYTLHVCTYVLNRGGNCRISKRKCVQLARDLIILVHMTVAKNWLPAKMLNQRGLSRYPGDTVLPRLRLVGVPVYECQLVHAIFFVLRHLHARNSSFQVPQVHKSFRIPVSFYQYVVGQEGPRHPSTAGPHSGTSMPLT